MTTMKIVRKTGCEIAVDEPLMPKRYWAEGPAIYEINHRCNNKWCFNKNHITFMCVREYTTLLNCPEAEPKPRTITKKTKLTYEQAQEIKELLKTTSRKEVMETYGVTSMVISHILAGRSYANKEGKKTYAKTARENRDEVWNDYLRINSIKAVCFKWDISPMTFQRMFKQEIKEYRPKQKNKGELNIQYSFKAS